MAEPDLDRDAIAQPHRYRSPGRQRCPRTNSCSQATPGRAGQAARTGTLLGPWGSSRSRRGRVAQVVLDYAVEDARVEDWRSKG